MPWNTLYWLTILALFIGAGVFAFLAENLRRDHLGIQAGDPPIVNEGDPVHVTLILNGDEIIIEKDQKRARLRMLGIHSFDPVVNEREITGFGRASVSFLETWILNKDVVIHFDEPKKDVRGRFLGYVEREHIDINARMVEQGLSMVYTEFPFAREATYSNRERNAREARLGIWGGDKAVARIRGLRATWARTRKERFGQPPPDALLWDALK